MSHLLDLDRRYGADDAGEWQVDTDLVVTLDNEEHSITRRDAQCLRSIEIGPPPPPGRSECPNRTPGHSFFSLVGRKTHARAASWSKAAVLEGSVQCPLWSIDPFVQPRRLVDGA
jgi:hypothetical protein